MARVNERKSDLQREYENFRGKMWLWRVVTGGAWALWMLNIIFAHSFNPYFLAPVFATFAIASLLQDMYSNRVKILEAGLTGEQFAQEALVSLPENYQIIPNLALAYGGQRTEIDSLVIGETGIFVVEVKYFRGILEGSEGDRTLTKYKVSSGGIEDTKSVNNPAGQVKRQIYKAKQQSTTSIGVFTPHGCG